MAEITWRFPMRCPECQEHAVRPSRVESRTATEVIVSLRCDACGHAWQAGRETPLLTPKPPPRMPPEDQA